MHDDINYDDPKTLDYGVALQWYLKAVELKEPSAMVNIGPKQIPNVRAFNKVTSSR